MSMTRMIPVLCLLALAGCNDNEIPLPLSDVGLSVEPSAMTYCCDPFAPPPPDGYYVGQITIVNSSEPASAGLSDESKTLEFHGSQGSIGAKGNVQLEPGVNTVAVYSRTCVTTVRQILITLGEARGQVVVTWECPDEPGAIVATYFALCGSTATVPGVAEYLGITSRASPGSPLSSLAGSGGIFTPDEEFIVAGKGGGSCCTLGGTALQDVISLDFHRGCVLPEVPGRASPAIFFHGSAIFAFSAWVPANNAFGMISLGGGFDNWTGCSPSGEENATDQFLLVGNMGSRIRPIVPLDFVPQWGLGSFDIVPPTMFLAAWGKPVTCARPERLGDIVVACEPSLTDPGTLVVVSMGGDDTADSSALVGQTGRQPRVLRAKDGVYGVTCFGENLLSLFRKTATGFEKIGDAVVGDGPIDLDVKRLPNGDIAFLCAGSRDDTWSTVVVNPATGDIISTATKPVPDLIEEPTSCVWADDTGNVYLLGRASRNIARFDSGVK